MESGKSNRVYHKGLEIGRAAFCIFVVAWHDRILGNYTKAELVDVRVFAPSVTDIIYHNLFFLAVPVFMTMSLYLYLTNRERSGYFIYRIRLFVLRQKQSAIQYIVCVQDRRHALYRELNEANPDVREVCMNSGKFSALFMILFIQHVGT